MAKILGFRDVQGIGFYEDAGATPDHAYDIQGFGATKDPYDLGEPGRVAEIKNVLIALGRHASDPSRSDPQTEDTFKFINTSPTFVDAWDGPTADAFALTAGRHKDRFPALMPTAKRTPLTQLAKFQDVHQHDVIVGGPQPTVAGLEAIAQAAHEVLKDSVQLNQYLAWRGGLLDCTAPKLGSCVPPDSVVVPTRRQGPSWNPRGLTIAWREGPIAQANPGLLSTLDLLDQSLETSWTLAPQETTEAARQARASSIIQLRQQRHNLVKKLNEGAPPPKCPDPALVWNSGKGGCIPRCPPGKRWEQALATCVIDVTPAQYPDYATCLTEQRKIATEEEATAACEAIFQRPGSPVVIAVVAAALGLGGYFLFKDKKIPKMITPR